jgi:hypothetical protein
MPVARRAPCIARSPSPAGAEFPAAPRRHTSRPTDCRALPGPAIPEVEPISVDRRREHLSRPSAHNFYQGGKAYASDLGPFKAPAREENHRPARFPLLPSRHRGEPKLRLLSGLIKAPLITESCCSPIGWELSRVWLMSDSFLAKSCLSPRHGRRRYAADLKTK